MVDIAGRYLDEWHVKHEPESTAAVTPIATWVFVSSNGNDSTGNGSIAEPFATLTAALASITDASPTKLYTVVLTSDATLSTLALPPYVYISGAGLQTKLTVSGGVTLSPQWALENDPVGGLSGLSLFGALSTVSGESKPIIQLSRVALWGPVVLDGGLQGAGFIVNASQFFAAVDLTGYDIISQNCVYTGGPVQVANDYDEFQFISSGDSFLGTLYVTRTSALLGPDVNVQNSFMNTLSVSGGLFVHVGIVPASYNIANGARVMPATVPATPGQNPRRWTSGSASPNGLVVGYPGDLYTNDAGGAATTLYVKETGLGTSSGWAAK
jgi:hypothetical protein